MDFLQDRGGERRGGGGREGGKVTPAAACLSFIPRLPQTRGFFLMWADRTLLHETSMWIITMRRNLVLCCKFSSFCLAQPLKKTELPCIHGSSVLSKDFTASTGFLCETCDADETETSFHCCSHATVLQRHLGGETGSLALWEGESWHFSGEIRTLNSGVGVAPTATPTLGMQAWQTPVSWWEVAQSLSSSALLQTAQRSEQSLHCFLLLWLHRTFATAHCEHGRWTRGCAKGGLPMGTPVGLGEVSPPEKYLPISVPI